MKSILSLIVILLLPQLLLSQETCAAKNNCDKVCEQYEKESLESCKSLCDSFECYKPKDKIKVKPQPKQTDNDSWILRKDGGDEWIITESEDYLERDPNNCIIINSVVCNDDCIDVKGRKTNLCRRGCLSKKCPKSNKYNIAEEANTPGATACSVCKESVLNNCNRNCANNLFLPPGKYPTNLNFSCNKICTLTYCSKECPLALSSLW